MARFSEDMRKNLFTPDFCFIDVDFIDPRPTFPDSDKPTKIVKTPKGYHCYWEDRPMECDEFVRLNVFYGGDLSTKQLYKIGTDLDGFVYYEV